MQKDIDFKLRKLQSTKNVVLKEDEDALAQIFEHMFCTRKGERPFNKNFGSDLPDFIGKQVSIIDAFSIRTIVVNGINNWLPNVNIDEGNVRIVVKPSQGAYEVEVRYYDDDNQEQQISFDFLWRR